MPKFELLHQEVAVTPFTLGLFYRGFHQKLQLKFIGPLYFKNSIVTHKDLKVDWYGDYDNFKEIADKIIKQIKKHGTFSTRLLKAVFEIGRRLRQKNQLISSLDLTKLSKQQLADELNQLYKLGNQISDLGSLAVIPDLRHAKLTTLLKQIIRQKIQQYHLNKQINDYFSPLITPL